MSAAPNVAARIDLGVSPVAVILICLLMVLVSAGFGVMLGSMVKTERSGDSAGVLAVLVMAPIGGSWCPLFIAPVWMQSLAKLTPHGWANTGFNKLMLFGAEFLIAEYFVNLTALREEISANPLKVENGYIELPTAPGLGMELKEDALARYPYHEPALRSIRRPGDEGP